MAAAFCMSGCWSLINFSKSSVALTGALLRRRAAAQKPQSASYALNLMHSLELELSYNEALDVAASFCRSTKCVTIVISHTNGSCRGLCTRHVSSACCTLACSGPTFHV